MQFLICPKHNRTEKAPYKLTTTSFVCMNRYCNQSFTSICAQCKSDHRDHSNKILNLEDITFLVERLLKTPFKQLALYMNDTVAIMKKFKLIQQNKRKIDILEKQVYSQVFGLVEFTESLIHQYAVCKKKITALSDILTNIQAPEVFAEFVKNSSSLLSNVDYNFQRDKFEYDNQAIRQKFESRKKAYQKTKRKLEELKDYSMKIIEVILANEDSESEEDDIVFKKKIYEILKRELQQNNPQTLINQPQSKFDTEKPISSNHSSTVLQPQNKMIDPDFFPKNTQTVLCIQKSSQTNTDWINSVEHSVKQYQLKIRRIQQLNAKSINELQNKISMIVKEKQSIKRELMTMQETKNNKNLKILDLQAKLRENKRAREEKERQRQTKLDRLIEIGNWKNILQGDRID